MPKRKMSMTIEEDAAAMLEEAAASQNASVSALAEKAIRAFCIDYAAHRLEVVVVGDGSVGITLERAGRAFYRHRPVPRLMSHGSDGVVTVDYTGPLVRSDVVSVLRSPPLWVTDEVKAGTTIEYERSGYSIRISFLTFASDGQPGRVRRILRRAADAVEDAEVMSLVDVLRRRCPRCGTSAIELRRWAAKDDIQSEGELVCPLGHHEPLPGLGQQ